jgi:uncharacterized iron-regulated membrane protein
MSLKRIHRYLSLAVAAIWLVQAVTGTLSVFRWEIDDATVAGDVVPVDWEKLGTRVDALAATPGTTVGSMWTSGSSANRFDVHHEVEGQGWVMRLDGQGQVLRLRSSEWVAAEGAVWDTITRIHTSLFAGDFGAWLIGISGILLVSNIILGLKLAWPARGTWTRSLFGRVPGKKTALLYGWHRKVGLWFAFPALVTVGAGTLMAFGGAVESALNAGLEDPPIPAAAPAGAGIGTGEALRIALARFPGSSFSGVSLPDEETPWYRVRIRATGEVPRKWGTTVVYVGRADGRVLSVYDATRPHPGRAVTDTLYPLHTGQIGGVVGRVIVFLLGCALMALVALGIPLWWKRRRPRAGSAAVEAPQPAHS